ncbi:MAG: purine-nucleoside phosphorylase [Gammaproteobacteria bacterium]|nr:purine-nucleoside phosphorylase [Gammaproteobacteria bacterium]
MKKPYDQILEVIHEVKPNFTPKMAIVLGSGLGKLAEEVQDSVVISYEKLPGFPQPGGVAGHAGKLHLGMLHGVPVACLQGRAHWYEGNMEPIKVIIRTMKLLGCEMLIQTNAVGSLRKEMQPGSLMAIQDHINMLGNNPLIGPNDEEFGERFVGMEDAYDPELRAKLLAVAKELGVELHEGIYQANAGPTFETPAENRAYAAWGADVVGMSTVPETIIARHCGLKVAAVSAITNLGAGLFEGVLSHEVTLEGAKLATNNLLKLVSAFVKTFHLG